MKRARLPAMRVLLGGVCLLVTGAAIAQAQPASARADDMDLAEVLRIARDAGPRMALQREAIVGAEVNRRAAGVYPNPTLSIGRSRPTGGQATLFSGSRQDQAMLDIPLLVAGQRAARIERAEREIEAARARAVAGAGSLAAEAGAAFVALLAAQEKVALLGRTNEELSRLREIVRGRAELGVASRYDATRLDVEVGGFGARFEDSKAEVADRAGILAALLGLPQLHPRASGALAPLAIDAAALQAPRGRTDASPAVAAAAGEERAAQSGIAVAQRERWPVPSVSVGRSWTSDPFGATNYLGLSVELTIFDNRRSAVDRAASEATSAKLRRELAQAEVAASLERYADVIKARQAALVRFDAESASRLAALKEMSEQAYRLGRSSIFELLDSTRSRFDLQQSRIELVSSLLEVQIRFLSTSGNLDRIAAANGARHAN